MGRFKAGDRVKILAGHPYYADRDDKGEELTGVVASDQGKAKGLRGKYIVDVDGSITALSFKGRELEALNAPDAQQPSTDTWVPKVGDRVRFTEDYSRKAKAGDEGEIVGFWNDDGNPQGGLSITMDNASTVSCYARRVEPLPPATVTEGSAAELAPFKIGDRVTNNDKTHVNVEDHWSKHFSAANGDIVDGALVVASVSEYDIGLSNKVGRAFFYMPVGMLEPAAPIEAETAPIAAEEPTAELAPFKIGQRIRCDDNGGAPSFFKVGATYTVKSFKGEASNPLVYVEETGAGMFARRFSAIPALTIEAGKFYRTRDGRKVGPILIYSSGEHFHVEDGTFLGDQLWNADGTVLSSNRANDLVAEWIDEPAVEAPAKPAAKFKVGDKVRALVSSFGDDFKKGEIYEVSAVEYGRVRVVSDSNGRVNGWGEGNFELAATPAQSFIVARLTASGEPRPNVRPRVHATLAEAEAEAQRLADRLGDTFAVFQRVSSKTVDAGPVPTHFNTVNAKCALTSAMALGSAFPWVDTKQGRAFWAAQFQSGLTYLGRAILKKWIAEAEAAPKVAA